MASNHQCWVMITSPSPAKAAIPKLMNAARFTSGGDARPEPTSRSGPTRSASVPRIPSE